MTKTNIDHWEEFMMQTFWILGKYCFVEWKKNGKKIASIQLRWWKMSKFADKLRHGFVNASSVALRVSLSIEHLILSVWSSVVSTLLLAALRNNNLFALVFYVRNNNLQVYKHHRKMMLNTDSVNPSCPASLSIRGLSINQWPICCVSNEHFKSVFFLLFSASLFQVIVQSVFTLILNVSANDMMYWYLDYFFWALKCFRHSAITNIVQWMAIAIYESRTSGDGKRTLIIIIVS